MAAAPRATASCSPWPPCCSPAPPCSPSKTGHGAAETRCKIRQTKEIFPAICCGHVTFLAKRRPTEASFDSHQGVMGPCRMQTMLALGWIKDVCDLWDGASCRKFCQIQTLVPDAANGAGFRKRDADNTCIGMD